MVDELIKKGISVDEIINKVNRAICKNKNNDLYQIDPLLWYKEKFKGDHRDIVWSDFPGYEKHEWDGDPDPFKKMFENLAKWKHVGIESATSTGKTFMLPRIAYWFLDVFPNSLVVSTAPKQQQLKSVLWAEMSNCFMDFKRIRPDAELFSLRVLPNGKSLNFRRGARSFFDETDSISESHQAIGVVSGVRADEESSVKMQGYHRKYMLFIIEECAGVPDPVITAIKNTCTGDFNAIIAVGNPDNVLDSLHKFSTLPYVEHIRISAFDHPNIVLKKTVIHGAVTQKSIDERKDEYGVESWLYKSRVRGICASQGVDSLIMYDWVVRAMMNDKKYEEIPDDTWSHNALGVDVANSKAGDQACLCWGKGNEVQSIHEFHCEDANALAHNLINNDPAVLESQGRMYYGTGTLEQWDVNFQNVGVDGVGIGVGTVNEFNALGWKIVSLTGGQWNEAIPFVIETLGLYLQQHSTTF